jgi:hypothetical protein
MLARTRNELEWTIFVLHKREIFQRKRVFCLAFQRNRELSQLGIWQGLAPGQPFLPDLLKKNAL